MNSKKRQLAKFGSRRERFDRRGFLGGLGGSGAAMMLALPALDALTGRTAIAKAEGQVRFVGLHTGSGMPMETWTPNQKGANYDLKETLKPFAPIQSKLNVLSGLGIIEGKASPGDHGAGVPATFTCVSPYPASDEKFRLGISVDQVAANEFAQYTRIPSLQLGLSEGANGGDGPFGPTYLKHVSWKDATSPLARTLEPAVVFDRLFAGYDPALSEEQNKQRLALRRSVLDYAAEDTTQLLKALGADDQKRMDQFLSSVREVEVQLAQAQLEGPACGGLTVTPPKTQLSYPDRFRAMSDLTVLALQCDITRVVTLQGTCFRNDDVYGDFLGTGKNHHSTSHPQNDRDRADYKKVCNWIAEQLAYTLKKMDEVMETDGTLLDNSIAVYNSDCGAAGVHDHEALPVLVAGTAGGKIPTGRHFEFTKGTDCAGLYVTLLNAMGIQIETFGEKKAGPLTLA